MIDLHERLSEFSFGYGVTREVERLLADLGLHVTPFMPSLVHEASLGFDVAFQSRGSVIALQFKLGEELRRFHKKPPVTSAPLLDRPFWRYKIDTTGHQFARLANFEHCGADVHYVAPRFSTWWHYEQAFHNETILEHSLLLRPSDIAQGITANGGTPGDHQIVYDRHRRYVCSIPSPLEEQTATKLGESVATKIRASDVRLRDRLFKIFSRSRDQESGISISRQKIAAAQVDPSDDELLLTVGMEAWSQGAQLLFVTEEPPLDPGD